MQHYPLEITTLLFKRRQKNDETGYERIVFTPTEDIS